MQEILFRGKQKDNGKWIEGYLVNVKWYLDDSNITMIVPKDATLFPRSELSGWEEVISETVGQFTGMLDKNGKKIFEGDVVRAMTDWGPAGMLESVVTIRYGIDDGYAWGFFYLDTIEVIGNVYDNPELLESMKNDIQT